MSEPETAHRRSSEPSPSTDETLRDALEAHAAAMPRLSMLDDEIAEASAHLTALLGCRVLGKSRPSSVSGAAPDQWSFARKCVQVGYDRANNERTYVRPTPSVEQASAWMDAIASDLAGSGAATTPPDTLRELREKVAKLPRRNFVPDELPLALANARAHVEFADVLALIDAARSPARMETNDATK